MVEPEQGDTKWSYDFESREQLKEALETYTAFQEGTLLRRYGHEGYRVAVDANGNPVLDETGQPILVFDPTPPGNPEGFAEAEMNAARRRAEIDRCMEAIASQCSHWHRLLDLYYRQGLSTHPRGWLYPAAKLGYHHPSCPALVRCPVVPGDNRMDLKTCQMAESYHCHWDFLMFRGQLGIAMSRLFYAHKVRHGKTKRRRGET